MVRTIASLLVIAALAAPASAQLTTQLIIDRPELSGLVAFVQDPQGANTFYLVRQSGTVRVLQNGELLPTPFLDLTESVGLGGERGLLGMAFAPDGRVFVNFTNTNGDIVVARFARAAGNPLTADPGSRLDLRWDDALDQRFIPHPGAANHNGGHLAFGADGFLYLGLGDGGNGNHQNAQNPNNLLGKMLRIDVSVPDGDPKGYRVPASNPFIGLSALPEIWAFGLRNPWRYSFDNPLRGGTGALVIGDVGQGTREEIDYEPAGRGGRNYGWPNREGGVATPDFNNPPMVPLPAVDPLIDYPRALGKAITGGYVYRGASLPAAFYGRYFVGDFVSGLVASVGLAVNRATHDAVFADAIDHSADLGGFGITSFAEDRDGELYIVRTGGSVRKIVPGVLPDAPAGFAGVVDGSTVQLSWSLPPVFPASYRLEVGSVSGAANVLVSTLPGTAATLTATAVPDGLYFVRLRGVNSIGVGPSSTELQVRVGCTAAPPPPGTLTWDINNGQVNLRWGPAAGATGYVLEAGSQAGAADLLVAPLGMASGLAVLPPEGTYHVRVRAQNACGGSGPSNEITVVVP